MTTNSLPDKWAEARLGDLGEWFGGGTPSKSKPEYWEGGTIPWVSPKDMKTLKLSDSEDHITQMGLGESHLELLPSNALLTVVRSGILAHTLPVAVLGASATINQDLKGLKLACEIDPLYIAWYLRAEQRSILETCTKSGTTVSSIETSKFKNLKVPLAPLPEQHRIVAKIEELFSDLDAGVAALERVRIALKRYRASVLKAAVEGRLTEQWREENPNVEPADELLRRVLDERRSQWEREQLAKFETKARRRSATWRDDYAEPAKPDGSRLPSLPETWSWVTLDQLGDAREQPVLTGPFGTALGRDDFQASGVPLLTIGALTYGPIDAAKALHVSEAKAEQLSRYRLRAGDILFSRMATVGRAGLVDEITEGSLFNYHLMRLRLADSVIVPAFVVTFVRGSSVVTDYVRDVNHGATRDGINTASLLQLPVPLPPLEEQAAILAVIGDLLLEADRADQVVATAMRRGDVLRRSVLRQAFLGRLVPQDPTDEPAPVLLDRIKAEREQVEQAKTPGRRPRQQRGSEKGYTLVPLPLDETE